MLNHHVMRSGKHRQRLAQHLHAVFGIPQFFSWQDSGVGLHGNRGHHIGYEYRVGGFEFEQRGKVFGHLVKLAQISFDNQLKLLSHWDKLFVRKRVRRSGQHSHCASDEQAGFDR